MAAYRIVLTDDHVLVRQGLRRIIESTAGLQVIAEAGSGVELLSILRRVTADLVILDIAMPGMRGLEAIHEINALHAHPKTLVLSMYGERDYVSEAMAAGASGYLLKEDADTQLFSAIDRIRRDRTYMSPRLVDELTYAWAGARRRNGNEDPALKAEPLTVREREILKMIAEARLSREIADMLHISLRTVEHHRASILTKLQLRRTAELVRYAVARHYL